MSVVQGGGAEVQMGGQKSIISNFMNHVFDFGDDSKSEMINLIQYACLSIIPIVVLNKTVHHLIPEANVMKGSLELSLELVGQVSLMLLGLTIIDRVVTFIPNYSGEDYKKASLLTFVLPFLMILLSLQTKVGEKANILYQRALGYWNGRNSMENFEEEDDDGNANVTKRQPIANNPATRTETASPPVQIPPQPPAGPVPNNTNVGGGGGGGGANRGGNNVMAPQLDAFGGNDNSFSSSYSAF